MNKFKVGERVIIKSEHKEFCGVATVLEVIYDENITAFDPKTGKEDQYTGYSYLTTAAKHPFIEDRLRPLPDAGMSWEDLRAILKSAKPTEIA